MKCKYIMLSLLVIVCNACKKTLPSIDSFEIVSEILNYDSIYSDRNDILGAIVDIEVIDNIIVARNISTDNYFSFIDIEKGILLDKWGRKGNGPNEYVQISSNFTILENHLVFLDETKKEINRVLISKIIENKDVLDVIKESYPYTVDFRPRHINIVNDKKIAVGAFKEGRFGIIDSENNIVPCQFEYPFNYGEITGIYRGNVFQSKIKSNYEEHKFAILTLSSDVFEIYQVSESGIHKVFISPFSDVPKIKKKPRGDAVYTIDYDKSIAGLMNMAVSKELICFMYSSQSYSEFVDTGVGAREILCFNWNGEKIKKYLLPFPINRFCIDGNYIYGVKNYEEETVIYRFEMQ